MSRIWLIFTRIGLLVAVLASAALYAHYLSPTDSGFCGIKSGCEVLRKSSLGSYDFGNRYVPLPLFGMIAFATVLGVSLWPGRTSAEAKQVGRGIFYLSAFGALSAIGLVLYQAFYAHAYCWLCLIVDGSAIVTGILAFALKRSSDAEATTEFVSPEVLPRWTWLGLGLLFLAAPLAWVFVRPLPPVPAEIREFYEPGKINVVEFADFECPYCRALHPILQTVILSYPGKVHFVRLNMPLEQHPMAESAARSAICAEQLDPARADEMANGLFTEKKLHKGTGKRLAKELGYDPDAFAQCLTSPETNVRLERDHRIVHSTGFHGLPTTYVGSEQFLGVRTEAAWRQTFDHALRGEGQWGVPGPVYLAAVTMLTLGLVLAGWKWRPKGSEPPA